MAYNKTHIGIDPGKTGGIVVIHPNGDVDTDVPPLIGKDYDLVEFNQMFKRLGELEGPLHCTLEWVDAGATQSKSTAFSFGGSFWLLRGLLTAHGIPTTLVKPTKWTKEIWKGIREIRKTSKGRRTKDTKAMSLQAARNLYPTLDLTATERSKIPHDGIVDALLLAEYGRRNFD